MLNPLTLYRQYRARQAAAKRDHEWRVGYLHAMDRRLFPDAPPMLPGPELQRLEADSIAFVFGKYWGARAPIIGTGLDQRAERERRLQAEVRL